MVAKLNPVSADRTRKVLLLASNPATSPVTGWEIGFWWSELVHPWYEFTEAGFEVTIASPSGGDLVADSWSDPRDESGYSAHDILSLGFISSPSHASLVEGTPALDEVDLADYDALFLVGGQGPMVTFYNDERVLWAVSDFHATGKVLGAICHATSVLLKATNPDGSLIVDSRTWTGFANSEEDYADAYVGRTIQPFRIETEARKLSGTNYVNAGQWVPFALRDGNLVTGQQQYSGAPAAREVIAAVGR
jgi:putative intracellular protease/amidase